MKSERVLSGPLIGVPASGRWFGFVEVVDGEILAAEITEPAEPYMEKSRVLHTSPHFTILCGTLNPAACLCPPPPYSFAISDTSIPSSVDLKLKIAEVPSK